MNAAARASARNNRQFDAQRCVASARGLDPSRALAVRQIDGLLEQLGYTLAIHCWRSAFGIQRRVQVRLRAAPVAIQRAR
jgi:hypothetical protein